MQSNLSITDLVALYGALVATIAAFISTIVLVFEIYKYKKSKPNLKVDLLPGMSTFNLPAYEGKEIVCIRVVNKGDKQTTLKLVSFKYYSSFFERLLRKPTKQGIISNPGITQPLPHLLKTGEEWAGAIEQNKEIENWSVKGILLCEIHDTMHDKPYRKRLKINQVRKGKENG